MLAAFVAAAVLIGVSWNIWAPAVLVSLVSFYDDRASLSPRVRLRRGRPLSRGAGGGNGPRRGMAVSPHLYRRNREFCESMEI